MAAATKLDLAGGRHGGPRSGDASVRDYWLVLKPNVMQLVVFTGLVGLYVAPGELHPLLALTAVLCIAVGSGSAAAINNWFDADIDRAMARTRLRPTASGLINPEEALAYGVTLGLLSVVFMGLALNWLAAGLLAFTIAFYVFVYTIWLKRRTPQNIVIGGAAGAFPPLVGWSAVTGEVAVMPALMFALIFFWTPPHFWALALYRCGDYAKVGVPMLPVVVGRSRTRRDILLYTIALVPLGLAPWLLGEAGLVYGAGAIALGGGFLAHAWALYRDDSDIAAMRTFRFSILYLFAIFTLMAADHWLLASWGRVSP
jgi:heme o synthase